MLCGRVKERRGLPACRPDRAAVHEPVLHAVEHRFAAGTALRPSSTLCLSGLDRILALWMYDVTDYLYILSRDYMAYVDVVIVLSHPEPNLWSLFNLPTTQVKFYDDGSIVTLKARSHDQMPRTSTH